MTDWKTALAALGGTDQPESKPQDSKDIARCKRTGVVYSTNPDYAYEQDEPDVADTLPNHQQPLRLAMERAGRGGKTATIIRGFVGSDDDLKALCKLLKQRCGLGGSAKDGEIIIQGDHRQRLLDLLKAQGYTSAR